MVRWPEDLLLTCSDNSHPLKMAVSPSTLLLVATGCSFSGWLTQLFSRLPLRSTALGMFSSCRPNCPAAPSSGCCDGPLIQVSGRDREQIHIQPHLGEQARPQFQIACAVARSRSNALRNMCGSNHPMIFGQIALIRCRMVAVIHAASLPRDPWIPSILFCKQFHCGCNRALSDQLTPAVIRAARSDAKGRADLDRIEYALGTIGRR